MKRTTIILTDDEISIVKHGLELFEEQILPAIVPEKIKEEQKTVKELKEKIWELENLPHSVGQKPIKPLMGTMSTSKVHDSDINVPDCIRVNIEVVDKWLVVGEITLEDFTKMLTGTVVNIKMLMSDVNIH